MEISINTYNDDDIIQHIGDIICCECSNAGFKITSLYVWSQVPHKINCLENYTAAMYISSQYTLTLKVKSSLIRFSHSEYPIWCSCCTPNGALLTP